MGQKLIVLAVHNVVTVNGTEACDMSNVFEFCAEQNRGTARHILSIEIVSIGVKITKKSYDNAPFGLVCHP